MHRTNRLLLSTLVAVVTLLTSGLQSRAQEGVLATVDSASLIIGQQTHLTLTFRFPEGARSGWPQWSDTLTGAIEIVKASAIDTLPVVNGLTGLQQVLTLSVFDSGTYFIPPIQVGYLRESDTAPTLFASNPIALNVRTVTVDTTQAFRDIKGPVNAPVTFREIVPWLAGGLLVLIVILFIFWFVRQKLRKKPIIPVRPKTVLPPDVEAIQLLEALRLQKLWQNGQVKLYFTELTDIVRHYLDRRYGVQAAEMTSVEIIESVSNLKINQEALSRLQGMLQLADLVKFAKMEPLPLENDTALQYAIDFVKETKPELPVLDVPTGDPLKESNRP